MSFFSPRSVWLHAALKERGSGYRETPLSTHSDPFALNPYWHFITLLRVTADVKFTFAPTHRAELGIPPQPLCQNPDDMSTKKKNIAAVRRLRIDGYDGSKDHFCTASPEQSLFCCLLLNLRVMTDDRIQIRFGEGRRNQVAAATVRLL